MKSFLFFLSVFLFFTSISHGFDSDHQQEKPKMLGFAAGKALFHLIGLSDFAKDYADLEDGNCFLEAKLTHSSRFNFFFPASETVVLIYRQHPERSVCQKANSIYGVYSDCVEDTINFFKGSPYCKEQLHPEKKQVINFDQSLNLVITEQIPDKPNSRKVRVLYYDLFPLEQK